MKKTSKYQLNLIETSDPFTPDSINQNTQSIEDEMVAHAVDGTTHSDIRAAISSHAADKNNPHAVTASQVGAAASSHNHSASNITSGTLPVARGGTGNTAVDTVPTSGSSKMVTSGGVFTALSGKADAGHDHSGEYFDTEASCAANTVLAAPNGTAGAATFRKLVAADLPNLNAGKIVSGTLAVGRGGTGYGSVDSKPTSGSGKMVTSSGVFDALSVKYGTDNPGWVTGTYVGTGVENEELAIDVGFQPSAVFITRVPNGNNSHVGYGFCIRSGDVQGAISSYDKTSQSSLSLTNLYFTITDTGFTVARLSDGYFYTLNEANVTYTYIAFK